jgi:hypothetical protein
MDAQNENDSQNNDWVEINHPENLLFGFLGAWLAFMLGLSLYSNEIQQSRAPHPGRNPAAQAEIPSLIRSQLTPSTDAEAFSKASTLEGIPAEAWLPILY